MSDPVIPKSPSLYGLYRFFPPSVYGPAPQNPAPFDLHGQVDLDRVRSLADQIVKVFLNSLPSNYVSQVKGPYYVQQFQAAAEELAKIQVLLADAYEDSDYDFTRTEVLYQFLATLVFPDAPNAGLPEINGDISYREFLKRMVALLLQGSKGVTLVQGIEALTDANVTLPATDSSSIDSLRSAFFASRSAFFSLFLCLTVCWLLACLTLGSLCFGSRILALLLSRPQLLSRLPDFR